MLTLTCLGSGLAAFLLSPAWTQGACRNRNAKKSSKSRLEASGDPLLYQVAVKVLRPNMEPVLRGGDASSDANPCLDSHFWVFPPSPKCGVHVLQVTLPTWSCLLWHYGEGSEWLITCRLCLPDGIHLWMSEMLARLPVDYYPVFCEPENSGEKQRMQYLSFPRKSEWAS